MVLSRFKSDDGEILGDLIDLPLNCTVEQLNLVCNALLKEEEPSPFLFFVNEKEIKSTLDSALDQNELTTEEVLEIIYQRQAVFRVRPVTRCTSSLPGHAEAVLSVSFSPDGRHLASGSGDTTVRFWDIETQTPVQTCKGHKNWVLCTAWSPDGTRLASACKNGQICIWNAETGAQIGRTMIGHTKWVTDLSWEPYHISPDCRRLASSSKDGDVRVWDVVTGITLFNLGGHTKSVTAVRWGGNGLLYTASQDTTIKVWRASDGVLCRTLKGHAHWVNSLTLNGDYVLRIGAFNPITNRSPKAEKISQQSALERFRATCPSGEERLVSGSDDFTMYMWRPESDTKPLARLTGHQQLINCVRFSPDGRFLASASFDKSVKLWDGRTGKFICSLRGHVQAVYMLAWSADSRLMVSGSADSTLKVWNVSKKKLEWDLPGHADEVYAVDWSPDGLRVASGGKDKVLKLWQH